MAEWAGKRMSKPSRRGGKSTGQATRKPSKRAAGESPGSSDGNRKRSNKRRSSRVEAEETLRELEAQLAAANKTISALLDKAERRQATGSVRAEVFEIAARMEQLVAQRTSEVEEKTAAFAAVNSELRALTKNLDQIVRERTRALTESESQLRDKNVELKRLNLMKAEFISIAAHELRTPLTSIVGYHDLMAEGRFGELPQSMKRPMASLQRNSHRLKRLVDEMLDVSRIEAGRVTLYRSDCDLEDIIINVVDELTPLASDKRQILRTDLAPIPKTYADADKIHQVVSNLVANAIRYTPEEGTIVVMTDKAPQDRFAGSWVRLRVRDDGIGIPYHLRARIFEPFSDVNTAKHHTSSGPDSAGLGLYIARGLVDLHGGLITVESEENEFTEFTVLLPLTES